MKSKEKHIHIGNITISSILAIFMYCIAGSLALGLEDRFYPIMSQNFLIIGCYFSMILLMLLCSTVLFLCGVILWKYDEK